MRKKFLTITFFCVGCGILITGCSSGYKIKPASVNQTGYVTQNPMSSAEYSLFLNKETTVFTNALVTRMNSIKNITKENKKEELAMIKTNLSDMEAAANEVRVTMPSVGRDEDKEAMDTAMEAAIEHMKSYKNALKKNKNTSEYKEYLIYFYPQYITNALQEAIRLKKATNIYVYKKEKNILFYKLAASKK